MRARIVLAMLLFSIGVNALYISTEKSQFLTNEKVQIRVCDYPRYDLIEDCEGDMDECGIPMENLTTTLTLYRADFPNLSSRSRLSSRTLKLDGCNETEFGILPTGIYVVFADNTEYNDSELFVVSDIGLMVKADSDSTLLMTFNLTDGTPLDANVSIYSLGDLYYSDFTDLNLTLTENYSTSDGEVMVSTNLSGVFLAESGGHRTLAFSQYYYWWGTQKYQAYIYTDRTIYRPGQTVHYKAILWEREDEAFIPVSDSEIKLTINDAKGNSIREDTVTTNAYGVVYGEIALDEEASLGYYSLQVQYDGEYFYQNIEVQEYEKPEYQVNVSSDSDVFLTGSTAEVTISAEYYFGGPVRDADVMYTVTTAPYWYRPPCSFGYRCLYTMYEFIAPPYSYYSETLASGTIKTDRDGKAKINVDLSEVESSTMLSVNVLVMDKSRKTVESSTSFRVERTSFSIQLRPDKYVYGTGEEARVRVETAGIQYEPSPGKTVSIRTTHEGTIVNEAEVVTDSDGLAYYVFSPSKEGTYRINATGIDENGREVRATAYIYVNSYTPSSYASLEVKFDKPYYDSGETVKAYVYTPVDTPLYWFTESTGMISHGMVEPSGNITGLEIDTDGLPATVYLSIFQIQNGTLYSTQSSFAVVTKENFLDVDISFDSRVYEPRDEARVTLRLTDSEGRPVQAQLSFALVDKSVLDIADIELESIEKYIYGSQVYNQVRTSFSWTLAPYYAYYDQRYGPVPEAIDMETLAVTKASGAAEGAQPAVRSYFPDTAYWMGFIETDSEGRASFSVPMPDSLTTWKAIVVSSDKAGRVGSGEAEVMVSKQVIIRLETPVFMTQKDSLIVSGVVHNYLNTSVDAYVYLDTGGGVELRGLNERIITLGSNSDDRVDWELEVTDCCSATLTAYAITSIESDAMKLTLPILPYGSDFYEHYSGEISDQEIIRVEKKGDIMNSSSLKLILTPSLLSTALEGLEFLVGYPYGCVEQTMSKFLPDVIVYETLKTLGIENKKLDEELPDMVSKGLQRLYNFQHADGGWGWWTDDEANAGMTAYVVLGLVWADNAGFDVDDEVIERGVQYLEGILDGIADTTSKIASIYTLSEAGVPYTGGIEEELTVHQKSMLALALYNSDRISEAQSLGTQILDAAKCDGDSCYWEGTGWHYRWEDNPVETTSLAVKALLRTHPSDERISKAIRWLVANRRGRAWRSTRDSALALMAITDYAGYSRELEGEYSARIYLNNKLISEYEVDRNNMFSVVMQKELYPLLSDGQNEIRIVKDGSGKLYYSLQYHYWTTAEDIPASSTRGIVLTRTYNTSEVDSGRELSVSLSLSAENQYEYLVLEDPIPAGTVVIDDSVRMDGTWARYEIRDEKLVFFVNDLWMDYMNVTYKLRARMPGEYHVLPARASLMYYPDVGATSSSARLTVEERARVSGSRINITETNLTIRIDFTKDVDEDVPGILTVKVTDSAGRSTTETRELRVLRSGSQEISLSPPSEDDEYTVEYTFTQGGAQYSGTKTVSSEGHSLVGYTAVTEDCCTLGAELFESMLVIVFALISAGVILFFTFHITRT